MSLAGAKILIICPKSVLGIWEDELNTWLNDKSATDVCVVTTQDFQVPPSGSITMINHDICHKLQEHLQSINFDVMICVEAHHLKSRTAKRTQAIFGSGKMNKKGIQAEYLWLLTGSPILNQPVELYPLLKAMDPHEIGSFDDYGQRYCDPKAVPRGHR
jgi:SWI/SNF-related matrix-associated actin-dependent regulator 1 of chromatin subfamily A